MRYVFILGRNPALSIAELKAKLPEASFAYLCAEALTAEVKGALDAKALMGELGGTIKIGEYIGECGAPDLENFLFEYLENAFAGKKIFFGISMLNSIFSNINSAYF